MTEWFSRKPWAAIWVPVLNQAAVDARCKQLSSRPTWPPDDVSRNPLYDVGSIGVQLLAWATSKRAILAGSAPHEYVEFEWGEEGWPAAATTTRYVRQHLSSREC